MKEEALELQYTIQKYLESQLCFLTAMDHDDTMVKGKSYKECFENILDINKKIAHLFGIKMLSVEELKLQAGEVSEIDKMFAMESPH